MMLQVVVVRGSNPAGACIVAHEVYTALAPLGPNNSNEALQKFSQATGVLL